MQTILARNVTEAWARFSRYMGSELYVNERTRKVRPRGVLTQEIIGPVATMYSQPEECVLLDPVRDCNPFFHLYESLWMLAGGEDVARVKFYSPQIAAYSDDAMTFHGAYGYRWRQYFEFDQLLKLIELLKKDPDTRRAVLAMWDAEDLVAADSGLDVPCNCTAFLQLREGALNLTVCNRSNDAVWGAYGANAVQFSILLQFLAAAVGARVGNYTQVSNSLHVYLEGKAGEVWQRCAASPPPLLQCNEPPVPHLPLVVSWETFLEETVALTAPMDGTPGLYTYTEPWIKSVALPLLNAHAMYRCGALGTAIEHLAATRVELDDPWLLASEAWLQRRWAQRGTQR